MSGQVCFYFNNGVNSEIVAVRAGPEAVQALKGMADDLATRLGETCIIVRASMALCVDGQMALGKKR